MKVKAEDIEKESWMSYDSRNMNWGRILKISLIGDIFGTEADS